jgi:hypothetical protein
MRSGSCAGPGGCSGGWLTTAPAARAGSAAPPGSSRPGPVSGALARTTNGPDKDYEIMTTLTRAGPGNGTGHSELTDPSAPAGPSDPE